MQQSVILIHEAQESSRTYAEYAWDLMESPLGALYMVVGPSGALRGITYGVDERAFLNQLDAPAPVVRNPQILAPVVRQLREYFDGARSQFDLPIDLGGLTPFQQSVLQVTRTIPAGAVWTYKEVAEAVGKPHAARAVGSALGRNPISVVIPCHRVIASDGSLGGYSGAGGLKTKELLLRLEGTLS